MAKQEENHAIFEPIIPIFNENGELQLNFPIEANTRKEEFDDLCWAVYKKFSSVEEWNTDGMPSLGHSENNTSLSLNENTVSNPNVSQKDSMADIISVAGSFGSHNIPLSNMYGQQLKNTSDKSESYYSKIDFKRDTFAGQSGSKENIFPSIVTIQQLGNISDTSGTNHSKLDFNGIAAAGFRENNPSSKIYALQLQNTSSKGGSNFHLFLPPILYVQQSGNISDTSGNNYSKINFNGDAVASPSGLHANIFPSMMFNQQMKNTSCTGGSNYSKIDFIRDAAAGLSSSRENCPSSNIHVLQCDKTSGTRKSSCSEKRFNGKWTCNLCQASFELKTQLEEHYLFHEGYHEIFCRICGEKLKKHAVKSREPYYKCCVLDCNLIESRESSFRKHLYIHSSLKLFKCKKCDKSFKQEKGRIYHTKNYCK